MFRRRRRRSWSRSRCSKTCRFTLELTGNTKAINEVKLEARVQGLLEQIKYVDGAAVKKGDLLFVIQQNTYQAQLDQAKATLEANKASQANAQVEYSRQSTLGQAAVRLAVSCR